MLPLTGALINKVPTMIPVSNVTTNVPPVTVMDTLVYLVLMKIDLYQIVPVSKDSMMMVSQPVDHVETNVQLVILMLTVPSVDQTETPHLPLFVLVKTVNMMTVMSVKLVTTDV